jgi:hypothetical protein
VVALLLQTSTVQSTQLKQKQVNEYFLSEDYLQTAAKAGDVDQGDIDDDSTLQLSRKAKDTSLTNEDKEKLKEKKKQAEAKGVSVGFLMSKEKFDAAYDDLKEARTDIFTISTGIKAAERERKRAVMSADMKALSKADTELDNFNMQFEPAQKALKEAEAAVKKSSGDRVKFTKGMKSDA